MDSAVSRGSIAQTARQFFPVPLVIGDRIQGVMTVATRSEKALNMAEILFLHETGAHVSAAVRALARMRELAVRDSLTGLYNRRGIKDMFDRAWNFASRYGHFIGVVILDVDRFKTLNDSYGHPTGDEVLREFAQLLLKVVRSVDIVGRFGGDEMVIILPAASAWNTRVLCERLLSEIRQHVFCERTHALRVTASLGAVSGTPQAVGRDGADNMMRWADQALYWAKRNGRDRLCLWSDTGPSGGRQTITEIEVPAAPVSGVKAGGPSRILIVDDEPDFSLVVEKMLSDEPYEITRAETAAAAMDRISQRSRCDVVLIDVGLAGESGIDLLEPLQKIDDTIVRIIVTGQATTENVVASLRRGAYDFIAKPFTQEQLLATLNRAVEFRRLLIENRNYQLHLEEMVRTRSVALSQALQQVRETHLFMLKALAALADAREHNTGQHSFRVSKLVRILGRGMGLPEKSVEELEHGALLHDIGKIAIPDAILLKPGPLDAEEWKVVRLHPEIGYKVLRGSPHLDGVARIVYEHQERFDGSGYPRGLKGAEICLAARIFAVVDTYDAMRSKRVYSDSSSSSAAVEEIKRFAGTKFDPSVVDNFLKCVSEIERTGNWPPA